VQTLEFGDISVTRVVEIDTPNSPRFTQYLFPTLTDEHLARHRAWLEPHFLEPDTGRLKMNIQAFVVRTRHHVILVDPCVGNDKNRAVRIWHQRQGTFLDDLARAGLRLEDVDYVLCTHLHVDHVGWNTRRVNGSWVPTFPKAKYLFSRMEWEYWRDKEGDEFGEVITDSVRPVVEAGRVELFEGELELDDQAHIVPTPGHTPGHVSLVLRSGRREAVITGDMIHHPIQLAHPDIATGACVDPDQAVVTRRAFLERYADTGAHILGTHFSGPTAGRIVERGGAFGFEY
jgi:glyoxylase-like metal-dependent hydrolase (beta-lactamase superfamily II)